jgi:hypothetical protein
MWMLLVVGSSWHLLSFVVVSFLQHWCCRKETPLSLLFAPDILALEESITLDLLTS